VHEDECSIFEEFQRRASLERTRHAVERAARKSDEAAAACERLLARLREDQLRCSECCRPWSDAPGARFRAYFTDDEPPAVLLFCPVCAAYEFD